MTSKDILLFAAVSLGVFISFDVTTAIRTGRARGKFGTITRARRPDAFRRYIIGDVIVLAFCLGVTIWLAINR
jgi:hypothetical protein